MKKIVIAFDVDWTLIWTQYNEDLNKIYPISNKRIVELLKILSSFKNTKIIVWSWQWKEWAKLITEKVKLEQYVDWYASKNHTWMVNWKHTFKPDITPDIAIDDIQACELWLINLIVKEK